MRQKLQRSNINRRSFLTGVGGVSLGGLAGCLSGPGDEGDDGDGDADNRATTTQESRDGPDTLLVIGYPESGIQLLQDFYREFDTDVEILVPDGMREEGLQDKVGYGMSNVRGTAPAAAGPGAEFFTELFEEEFGSQPGVYTAQAYDATACLLLANLAAGANDGPGVRDNFRAIANPEGETFAPADLDDAVEAAAAGQQIDYVGASSAVDFDSNGDAAAAVYEVFGFGESGLQAEELLPFQSEADMPDPEVSGSGSGGGRTVKVGVLQPASGDLGSVGTPIMNAGELPAIQLNGADTGFSFDVKTADTKTDAATGVKAAQDLVDAGYPGICGAAASSTTLRVAKEVVVPNEVVSCSPASTSPTITGLEDDDYVFRTPPTDALQGEVLGQYAFDIGAIKVSVLYVDNDYGRSLADLFTETFHDRMGGLVAAEVPFQKGQSSYTEQLDEALSPS